MHIFAFASTSFPFVEVRLDNNLLPGTTQKKIMLVA